MRLNRNVSSLVVLITGCLVAGILFIVDSNASFPNKPHNQQNVIAADAVVLPADYYRVSKTADGDTFDVIINGETKHVRMLGVDTPETKDPRKPVQCFGKEASAYTKRMLENTVVRLEIDPTQDAVDMYGRWLRYVFLPDGTNFNEKLVSEGYAYEYTFKTPGQYQPQLKTAEQAARAQRRGLWADDACDSVN